VPYPNFGGYRAAALIWIMVFPAVHRESEEDWANLRAWLQVGMADFE